VTRANASPTTHYVPQFSYIIPYSLHSSSALKCFHDRTVKKTPSLTGGGFFVLAEKWAVYGKFNPSLKDVKFLQKRDGWWPAESSHFS
jgi:hypothetical protein